MAANRTQGLITFGIWLFGILAAWEIGGWISNGDMNALSYAAIGGVICAIGITILRDWRLGFYSFLIWLLLEDLVRKFMGNNMLIYFAKDVLAAITYVSLFATVRKRREPLFHPPFLTWFGLFFFLGLVQVFNPFSPSLLYGLLGLKLYFYYFPLILVGYALIHDEENLHRFLLASMILASVISILGIIQAIVGPTFLNPANLAPEIRDLSTLVRYAPISGTSVFRPSSVFVSDGRFASYLLMMWILSLGASGYYLLQRRHGRVIVFVSTGLIAVAITLSGSRGAFVQSVASTLVLVAAFLWSAPLTSRQSRRLAGALGRTCLAGAIGLLLAITFYPKEIGARWDFYYETLSPSSPYSELVGRSMDYPTENLEFAFTQPNWGFGNGIGTASLGAQYVSKIEPGHRLTMGVESGWGNLILELGLLGLALWIAWTVAAVIACWKVTMSLRRTHYSPIAFAIVWFVFLLLIPTAYHSIDQYQDFILNAYLWLLMGILFRLPSLVSAAELVSPRKTLNGESIAPPAVGR
jgi:hypothetical protein